MGPSQESARESSRTNSNTTDPLPQKGAITIMMDLPQLQMEDFHQLLRISMPQSNNLRRVRLCLSKPKTTVTACSLQKMQKQRRTVILRRKEEEGRKEEERRKMLMLTKENSLKKNLKNLKKAPTSKKKESMRSMRRKSRKRSIRNTRKRRKRKPSRKRIMRNPRKRDHPRKKKKLETTDKVKVYSIF